MARAARAAAAVFLVLFAAATAAGRSLPGQAGARRETSAAAAAGRQLLQTTASECAAKIDNCVACRPSGNRTVCTKCGTGYMVKALGRSCWCAPGFYLSPETGACSPCGAGFYCPGAKASATSAVRMPCGAHKNTTTDYARSDRECLVEPGYGWAPGDGSSLCPVGSFNPGRNTRRCTACPGILSTAEPGATSTAACQAPPGYARVASSQQLFACPRGMYKWAAGDVNCTSCPLGFTTPEDQTAATEAADCNVVEPGYRAPPGAVLGETDAEHCSEDTYRSSEAPYSNATGIACTPCPAGTQAQAEGATGPEACLAPPGFGYDGGNGTAYECPVGEYNLGWNRLPCTPCDGAGGSITTATPGADGPDHCLVPAGHYSFVAPDGGMSSEPCPVGQFGLSAPAPGLQVPVSCSACPEFTTTDEEGSTDSSACLTLPGHGYYDGGVEQCDVGTYSEGHSQQPCTQCQYGYTTAAADGSPLAGATGPEACQPAPGLTPIPTGGLKPCPQGWYKSATGSSDCVRCPAGTTTTLVGGGATQQSDCDACLPGYGIASIDPASPSCGLCPSGWYSPGKAAGGAPCQACPRPPGFTGRMVSRLGIATPEGCFPEFPSDGALSHQTWNLIEMSDAALTQTADASVTACQAACAADPACQYFAFKTQDSRCSLRNKVAYTLKVDVDSNSSSKEYVLFQINDNRYVAYEAHPSDAQSLGEPLKAYQTRLEAQFGCNADASCVGMKKIRDGGASPWRTFAGTLWEDVTGKIRIFGESIDPWSPGVTATR